MPWTCRSGQRCCRCSRAPRSSSLTASGRVPLTALLQASGLPALLPCAAPLRCWPRLPALFCSPHLLAWPPAPSLNLSLPRSLKEAQLARQWRHPRTLAQTSGRDDKRLSRVYVDGTAAGPLQPCRGGECEEGIFNKQLQISCVKNRSVYKVPIYPS